MSLSDVKIRDAICHYGRVLSGRGMTPGSSGNISVKLEDGSFILTPTNSSLGHLSPESLSHLGPDGRHLSGGAPTKEIPLHMALYESRPSTRAVVHLHSTYAVALSILPDLDPRSALPPLTPYFVMRVGDLALVPYFAPGDAAVAEAIRALRGRHAALLLANHGPVIGGASLESAVFAAEELEETARLYLLVKDHNPRLLTNEQAAELSARFGNPNSA